jgi:hypothetical protein
MSAVQPAPGFPHDALNEWGGESWRAFARAEHEAALAAEREKAAALVDEVLAYEDATEAVIDALLGGDSVTEAKKREVEAAAKMFDLAAASADLKEASE